MSSPLPPTTTGQSIEQPIEESIEQSVEQSVEQLIDQYYNEEDGRLEDERLTEFHPTLDDDSYDPEQYKEYIGEFIHQQWPSQEVADWLNDALRAPSDSQSSTDTPVPEGDIPVPADKHSPTHMPSPAQHQALDLIRQASRHSSPDEMPPWMAAVLQLLHYNDQEPEADPSDTQGTQEYNDQEPVAGPSYTQDTQEYRDQDPVASPSNPQGAPGLPSSTPPLIPEFTAEPRPFDDKRRIHISVSDM